MNLNEFQSSFFEVQSSERGCLLTMTAPQLTEEENLERLDEDLISIVDNYAARKVVVDLSSVRYMTSSAIGKLIALHRRLIRNEGKLVLCHLQKDVVGILETSHLLNYFHVAENAEQALTTLDQSNLNDARLGESNIDQSNPDKDA